MSINIQKKLLYIPIANFIIAFCLLARCFKFKIKTTWLLKKYALILVGIAIVVFIRCLLAWAIDNSIFDNIIFYVDVYFSFFIIAKVCLNAQVELEQTNERR